MLITSRFRYAVMFMVGVAKGSSFGATLLPAKMPIRMGQVAKDQSISEGYLERIVADLRRFGLLEVTRGPGGGYCLSKDWRFVKLSDIADALQEDFRVTRCAGGDVGCLTGGGRCFTHDLWDDFGNYCDAYLKNTALSDVVAFGVGEERRIYADYNAAMPISKAVKVEVNRVLSANICNPSSLHFQGQKTRKILDDAREVLKDVLSACCHEVVFTASGTEANNLVMKGLKGCRQLVAATEHVSVLNAAIDPLIVPVDSDGVVDLEQLRAMLVELSGQKILVSVMLVNNETGVIQPIKTIAQMVHEFAGLLHVDAIQALAKMPIDINDLNADLLTVSAHKIGGISGAAAVLFNRSASELAPLITGGGQEGGLRAGTENILAIAAFATALRGVSNMILAYDRVIVLRDQLESKILQVAPEAVIFGFGATRIGNTTCICMPGVSNDLQLLSFDACGIAVSVGAACSSGKIELSHVLSAMGVREEYMRCSIRISIGVGTTDADIEKIADSWYRIYQNYVKIVNCNLL